MRGADLSLSAGFYTARNQMSKRERTPLLHFNRQSGRVKSPHSLHTVSATRDAYICPCGPLGDVLLVVTAPLKNAGSRA